MVGQEFNRNFFINQGLHLRAMPLIIDLGSHLTGELREDLELFGQLVNAFIGEELRRKGIWNGVAE